MHKSLLWRVTYQKGAHMLQSILPCNGEAHSGERLTDNTGYIWHLSSDASIPLSRPSASFILVTWDKFSDTGLCVCHISGIKHSWVLVQRKIGKALEWKGMRLTKCPTCTINLNASFHVLQLGIHIDLWVIVAATTQGIHKTYIKRPGWGGRWDSRQKEQAKSLGRWLRKVRAAWQWNKSGYRNIWFPGCRFSNLATWPFSSFLW